MLGIAPDQTQLYSRVREAKRQESHYSLNSTEKAILLVRHLLNTKRITGEIRLHVSQGACNSVTTIETVIE